MSLNEKNNVLSFPINLTYDSTNSFSSTHINVFMQIKYLQSTKRCSRTEVKIKGPTHCKTNRSD